MIIEIVMTPALVTVQVVMTTGERMTIMMMINILLRGIIRAKAFCGDIRSIPFTSCSRDGERPDGWQHMMLRRHGASYAAIRQVLLILSCVIGGFSSSPRNRLAPVFLSFLVAITWMMFPDLYQVIATRNEKKTLATRFLGDPES
jgi:hypothetical protein